MYKYKFTNEEWTQLKLFVHNTSFALIALGTTGNRIKKAWAIRNAVNSSERIDNQLHRELLIDEPADEVYQRFMALAADLDKFDSFRSKAKSILKSKLTDFEYQQFILSMFINAMHVAASSSSGFFRKEISPSQNKCIADFVYFFELKGDLGLK